MADIEWSEEQAMLASAARERLAAHDLSAVRAVMHSELGYDPALYRELAQLGWLGVAIDERYGGAGLGAGSLVALCEPMGEALLATPFQSTLLAAELIATAGDDAQKHAWLPRLSSGDAIGSAALYEPDGSFELGAPALTAAREGSGYRLTGTKTCVTDALAADLLVVSAALDETLDTEPALFLLERATLPPGALHRHVLIDETRRAYRLDLDGVELPPESRLPGDAREALARTSRLGALLTAAEATGGTAAVMNLTVAYLQTRKQFGKPIGGYQALKHPMAEILVLHEEARSLLYHAATCLDRAGGTGGRRDAVDSAAQLALHMAKAHSSQTFTHAADRSIQFHGAIGFTYECHAQLFLRRALFLNALFGDPRHHERKLEALVLDTDSLFTSP